MRAMAETIPLTPAVRTGAAIFVGTFAGALVGLFVFLALALTRTVSGAGAVVVAIPVGLMVAVLVGRLVHRGLRGTGSADGAGPRSARLLTLIACFNALGGIFQILRGAGIVGTGGKESDVFTGFVLLALAGLTLYGSGKASGRTSA
jgi:hypothetical protein